MPNCFPIHNFGLQDSSGKPRRCNSPATPIALASTPDHLVIFCCAVLCLISIQTGYVDDFENEPPLLEDSSGEAAAQDLGLGSFLWHDYLTARMGNKSPSIREGTLAYLAIIFLSHRGEEDESASDLTVDSVSPNPIYGCTACLVHAPNEPCREFQHRLWNAP